MKTKTIVVAEGLTYQPPGNRPPVIVTVHVECADLDLAIRAAGAVAVLLPGMWYPTLFPYLQGKLSITPDALLKWAAENGHKPSHDFSDMAALVAAAVKARSEGVL